MTLPYATINSQQSILCKHTGPVHTGPSARRLGNVCLGERINRGQVIRRSRELLDRWKEKPLMGILPPKCIDSRLVALHLDLQMEVRLVNILLAPENEEKIIVHYNYYN